MGINFDEMKNKAQDMLGKHSDKVEQGVDKASEAAKGKFGDHSDKIDNATGKAKEFLNKDKGGGAGGDPQQGPGQEGGGRPPA